MRTSGEGDGVDGGVRRQARPGRLAPARRSERSAGGRAIDIKQYQDALPGASSGAARRSRFGKYSRLVYSHGGPANGPCVALRKNGAAVSRGDQRWRSYLSRSAGGAQQREPSIRGQRCLELAKILAGLAGARSGG